MTTLVELNAEMDPVAAVQRLYAHVDALGPRPRPGALLALRVVDPAMGDGRRLLACGRVLAMRLTWAWTAHGRPEPPIDLRADPTAAARRLVATGCLYGLAAEREAVTAVRRLIQRWAVDRGTAPVCVDHAIRRGERGLGFSVGHLAAFEPARAAAPHPVIGPRLQAIHDDHPRLRQAVLEQAPWDARAARAALRRADAHLDAMRVVGDVLAGWAHGARAGCRSERRRRLDLVVRWLSGEAGEVEARLRRLQAATRRRWATFHWQSEFSELEQQPVPRAYQEAV